MRRKKKFIKQIIALILCITLLSSQFNTIDADPSPSSNTQEQQDVQVSTQDTETSMTEETTTTTTAKKDETTKEIKSYIKNGKICIYNEKQLKQIGTGKTIYTGDKDGKIGTGEAVKQEGKIMTYRADQDYLLMNDIDLDTKEIFTIPDSFTGTITGKKVQKDEKLDLYDKEKDTIYIYNPYQLLVLGEEDSEKEPVMSFTASQDRKWGYGLWCGVSGV